MKYRNAAEYLPEQLLREVQKHAQGELLYVPKMQRQPWGEGTGARQFYDQRNAEIRAQYQHKKDISVLGDANFLSDETVRKIVYAIDTLHQFYKEHTMHNNSASEAYKAAGVDITAGYEAVKLMQTHIARTKTAGAISGIGGFGGLFELDLTDTPNPVLVSGTDGVGTKIVLAFLLNKHDTIGIDCVAMCVNDVICCGAKPLLFLDYIGMGKNIPERVASIVSGVAEGCVQSGCALIGGECAEMPGVYNEEEYDLVGYCTGVVDKSNILDPASIQPGDAIIALPSSGVHSNGFSLVRKVFNVDAQALAVHYDELGGTLGETLLTPTKIYVKPILALLEQCAVKSISHITGGGFYENIPRSLPKGLSAKIDQSSLQIPAIFDLIARTGGVSERDMFNTFNMGVGMCVVVAPEFADRAVEVLRANGEAAYVMGEVVQGDDGVVFA